MNEAAVLFLFFLSGVSALAYEVVWQSRLAGIIGATSLSAAMVLTVFMGGLALGAALAPRILGRGRRVFFESMDGIRLFALAEAAIGLWAIAAPFTFRLVAMGGGLFGPRVFKPLADLILASVVMLPPAIMMGLTLPALTSHLANRNVRQSLGVAYFVNVSGGAAGSLAWGLWLIPSLGLRASELLAGGINFVVAFSAFVFLCPRQVANDSLPVPSTETKAASHLPLPEIKAASPLGSPEANGPAVNVSTGIALPAAAIFAASGISMALEVLFFRFNILIVGATAQSFSIMLAGFLVGISAGAALARAMIARGVAPLMVSLLSCLAALAGLCGIGFVFERLPYLFHLARAAAGESYASWLAVKGLFCWALTMVPAAGLGAMFPALHSEIARRRGGETSATSGFASSVSCAGSLLGSLAAGLLLLPMAGLPLSLAIVSGFAALLCCVLAAASLPRATLTLGSCALASVLGFIAWTRFAESGPHTFISGVFYRDSGYRGVKSFDEFQRVNGGRAVVYFRDDGEALVSVTSRDGFLGLQVNGKTDASNMPDDMATQLALGHLPAIFRGGDPGRSLVLGWGSGVTVAAVAKHSPASLSCVEISPAVVEASKLFSRVNDNMTNGQARIVMADGRVFMASLPDASLDLIVSEPSNPWISGMSRLFTVEHFAACRRLLAPGGVFCQWVQSYEMDDETFRIMVRSFLDSFPGASLWALGHHDFALLCTPEPPAAFVARFDPSILPVEVVRDLEKIGLDTRAGLAASMVMDPAALATYAGKGPVNTDDSMILQYRAPRFLIDGAEVAGMRVSLGVENPGFLSCAEFPIRAGFDSSAEAEAEGLFSAGRRMEVLGDRKTAKGFYERAAALSPGFPQPLIHLSAIETASGRAERAASLLAGLGPGFDPLTLKASTGLVLARLLEGAGNYSGALVLRESIMEAWPLDFHNAVGVARNLRKTGQEGKARQILETLVKRDPLFGPAWLDLGLDFLSTGKFDLAELHLSRAVELDPADATALHNLGVVKMKLKRFEEGAKDFAAAALASPGWHAPGVNLAECLVRSGRLAEADGVYADLVERFDDKPAVLNNAGVHFASRRDYRRAIDAYRRLAAVDLRLAPAAIAEIERLEGFLNLGDRNLRRDGNSSGN